MKYDHLKDDIQECLDAGMKVCEIQSFLGLIHHSVVSRVIEKFNLEIYEAFDEKPTENIQEERFEWLKEEDLLEEVTREAFEEGVCYLGDAIKRENRTAVSSYVKNEYGSIKGYLENHGLKELESDIKCECRNCGYKPVSDFYEGGGSLGVRNTCKNCDISKLVIFTKENPEAAKNWRDLNRNKVREIVLKSYIKRKTTEKNLPFTFDAEENEQIYGVRCLLTDSEDTNYDHFVPISWGCEGSTNANMYPLRSDLNSSKWAKNPFKWFDYAEGKFELNPLKFDRLVETLAQQNGLTPQEYEDFVHWCEDNKRSAEEITEDPRPALDIWTELRRKEDAI